MPAKIPATVITGFLGAGKTTIIRHLLANAKGKRIALVINEFGDLGVDAGILDGCGDESCQNGDIVELANGCICCTVADEFVPTMKALIEREDKPDHIVIETSGLALPQPLVRAFNWPEVRNALTVDGVVTIVDARALDEGRFAHDEARVQSMREGDDNIDHDTPLAELFEDQLACADLVVMSKADQLAPEKLSRLSAGLREKLHPGVKLIQGHHGQIDPEVLLGMHTAAEENLDSRAEWHHRHHDDEHHDDEHAHGHDEFASFVLDLPAIDDPEALKSRIQHTARTHPVLRVKGFACVPGKPMRMVIQAVGSRVESYFDRKLMPDEEGRTRLVVIGMHDLDCQAVEQALAGG